MRTLLAAMTALLLVACGECDCCKKGTEPAKPATEKATTAQAAVTAPAPAASGTDDPEAERKPPAVTAAWRGSGDVIELSVWEMHCGGCAALVEDGFKSVAGVKAVDADYETSLVKVTLTDAKERETVIAKLPAALDSVNAKEKKEFRVLGR